MLLAIISGQRHKKAASVDQKVFRAQHLFPELRYTSGITRSAFVPLSLREARSQSYHLEGTGYGKYSVASCLKDMLSLWCCGTRQGRLKKSSFTSIFKTPRKNPVVNTSDSQISKAQLKSEQVSPFEGPIELCHIYSSHAETEDVRFSVELARANAFEGIKARMVKHLSQDGSSRRQSRVSIGHSDEELARRAEVRRLRQKRIQDELERDNENQVPSIGSNHSTQQPATFIDLGSPRSGPRDTIEFNFDDCAVASSPDSVFSSSPCSQTCTATGPPNAQTGETCYSAGCSLPLETRSDTDDIPSRISMHRDPLPKIKRHSMVSMPTSRRPSSCEPGSSRMERILGFESDFNIRHGSHAWDDQSALGVWLIAQGMKSNDSSVPPAEQSIRAESPPAHHPSSTANDIGGVDSIMESSFSVPDGANKAKSLLSANVELENTESGCASTEENGQNQPRCPESDAFTSGKVKEKGSSSYPSAMPSIGSSSSLSEARSYVLSQQDIENLELSPIRWYGRLPTWKDLGHSEGKSSYATAEEQFLSNMADDGDMPELVGAYICQSDNPAKSSRKARLAEQQATAPDLNKPLPTPGLRGSLEDESNIPPSQSRGAHDDLSQGTPKRASLKERLQKSLSGLSKLGDNNIAESTIPEVSSNRPSQKPTVLL